MNKKELLNKKKKWAVVWKRNKKILSLYGMEAEKWRSKNTDWEVVPVNINY